ncbi:IS66 family transposase [Carboxylicivirga marina]|uniref:IS66 family transposase n=1 Tax=Carboxylicivirga marina TaxID=2800988 RepID=A0ABS1HRZ3_9BACT|nr:IS66 family transposase [Carboxylicivirga marina]MBK3520033.1 IS66 family transposase [Carboxylicivirga marina]
MTDKELVVFLRAQNTKLISTIEELTKELAALKEAILEKDKGAEKLKRLATINLPKKTEKRQNTSSFLENKLQAPTPKERGNNGAKRKVYDNIEEFVEEVLPSDASFDEKAAVYLFHRDVIRYEYIPPRLIKHIYRCKKYRMGDDFFEGNAPIAPFLNSNFDSSLLAHLIQQRYVYGLPVERIMKYLNEMGVDIPKATTHGLIEKSAELLDRLMPVLKDTILEDAYIHFDETYHTILGSDKGSRKGYFWSAFSHQNNLIQFIYENGSRSKTVFTNYLPNDYQGAVQTDGYSSYKVLEGWDYPKAIRLGCVQHCKRKFIEIGEQTQAQEVIDLYNEFYSIRKKKPKEKWKQDSLKVYKKLEKKLREIERDPEVLPNHILSKATAYCLNELESIYNIIISTSYDLDNNIIERPMRYISISRRNSLFCGSNAGARRTAILYSLAVSCRLNNVNTFSYFKDVIQRLAESPTMTHEQMRSLLPDRWAE